MAPAFITKVDIGADGTVLELIDDLLSVECWRFSDGKIILESHGCPTDHNHAVTIVAYTAAVEGRGGESTFEKICPPSFEKNCTKTLIFHETCTPEPHCTF